MLSITSTLSTVNYTSIHYLKHFILTKLLFQGNWRNSADEKTAQLFSAIKHFAMQTN